MGNGISCAVPGTYWTPLGCISRGQPKTKFIRDRTDDSSLDILIIYAHVKLLLFVLIIASTGVALWLTIDSKKRVGRMVRRTQMLERDLEMAERIREKEGLLEGE